MLQTIRGRAALVCVTVLSVALFWSSPRTVLTQSAGPSETGAEPVQIWPPDAAAVADVPTGDRPSITPFLPAADRPTGAAVLVVPRHPQRIPRRREDWCHRRCPLVARPGHCGICPEVATGGLVAAPRCRWRRCSRRAVHPRPRGRIQCLGVARRHHRPRAWARHSPVEALNTPADRPRPRHRIQWRTSRPHPR